MDWFRYVGTLKIAPGPPSGIRRCTRANLISNLENPLWAQNGSMCITICYSWPSTDFRHWDLTKKETHLLLPQCQCMSFIRSLHLSHMFSFFGNRRLHWRKNIFFRPHIQLYGISLDQAGYAHSQGRTWLWGDEHIQREGTNHLWWIQVS